KIEYKAKSNGVVSELIANEIGVASMMLGAGRQTKEDEIDLSVSIASFNSNALPIARPSGWLISEIIAIVFLPTLLPILTIA
ncbi:hypothetical protein BUY47_12185, partial [Staphylococcus devriesei]